METTPTSIIETLTQTCYTAAERGKFLVVRPIGDTIGLCNEETDQVEMVLSGSSPGMQEVVTSVRDLGWIKTKQKYL